jgi:RNA polymerase sigma factor (sigma-70 family)
MTMIMDSDVKALEAYCGTRAGEAFAEVVAVHAEWVYGAAVRMVEDREMAEDVTQAVFLLLAQRPEKAAGRSLAGWLFKVTRYCAAHAVRGEARRGRHERRAAAMVSETVDGEVPVWEEIAVSLDEEVSRLRESERQLILLRFYQGKSMAEIGAVLNVPEDTARKRVGAAVEKLRRLFKVKGVGVSAVGLGAVLAARTTQAVPVGFKTSVCAGAMAPSAKVLALAQGVSKMIVLAKIQVAVVAGSVVLVLASVGGLLVARVMAEGAPGGGAVVQSSPVSIPSPATAPAEMVADPERTKLAPAEQVDNPAYAAWAKFKRLSSATYIMDNGAGFGSARGEPQITRTYTLVDVAADAVTLEVLDKVNGKAEPMRPAKMMIPAKVEKGAADVPPLDIGHVRKIEVKESKSGTESVDVKSVKTETATREMTVEVTALSKNPIKIKIKTWSASSIPGGLVKMENQMHMSLGEDRTSDASRTMTLADFDVAK